jgi:hypothetical protein
MEPRTTAQPSLQVRAQETDDVGNCASLRNCVSRSRVTTFVSQVYIQNDVTAGIASITVYSSNSTELSQLTASYSQN